MKDYSLFTELEFGKYKGKSLGQVIELDESYIKWCAINANQFFVSPKNEELINEWYKSHKVQEKNKFSFSEIERKMMNQRYNTYISDINEYKTEKLIEKHMSRTFEQYSGSWAQEIEGWSDEMINDGLDGNPDAYWNID